MRSSKPWVQALNIDPNKVTAWAVEVPRHESITFWCLERGHLRSKEYFDWARDHYGLPQVKEEYFRQDANRELWEKIHSVANWSPQMLPLEEWDGIVFVGCVEPPEDILWSFPVQYVLAAASDLKNHWERLQAEPTKVSITGIDLKAINLTMGGPVAAEAAVKMPELNLGAPAAAPDANAPVMSEPGAPAMVAPIINLAPTVAPPTVTITPPAAVAPAAPTAAPATDSPEGLKVDFSLNLDSDPMDKTAISSVNIEAPEGLSFGAASAPADAVPEGLSIAEDHSIFEQDEVPTGAHPTVAAEAPAPLPPPPATPPMTEDTTGFTLINDSKNEGSIDSDALAPQKFEAAKNEVERLAWIFQQLKQHFKQSWVFYINNEKLVPWKWEKSVAPTSSAAQEPIDLQQPSLFRVVYRTKMPYHGPVISNLINTSFFKNWGLKATPPHVTATPIVMDGILVAILIASGNAPTDSDAVLRFVEKLTPAVVSAMSQKSAA